jgi:hypothetical protein
MTKDKLLNLFRPLYPPLLAGNILENKLQKVENFHAAILQHYEFTIISTLPFK